VVFSLTYATQLCGYDTDGQNFPGSISHAAEMGSHDAPDTQETSAPAPPPPARSRPKLDMTDHRKKGKSMFGILVGTLNKAKIEDKERSASEAVCLRDYSSFVGLAAYRCDRPGSGSQ
jgi:hypothetical protein